VALGVARLVARAVSNRDVAKSTSPFMDSANAVIVVFRSIFFPLCGGSRGLLRCSTRGKDHELLAN
jgi:hypothetical protein